MSLLSKADIKIAKELISPPGDTLLETLESRGIKQSELAQRMGRPIKTINEIIKGKAAIIPETAIQLERVLGISADFWLTREKNYRLELAEIEEAERNIHELEWIKNFPIKEMQKLGWILSEEKKDNLLNQIFSFFSIANVGSFDHYYHKNRYSTAFRISEKSKHNPYSIAAWLRQGEIQASQFSVPAFDKKKFKTILSKIKSFMMLSSENIFPELQTLCADCGVKLVHTPNLPKAPINGATRWIGDNPLIQLSGRYDRNDNFWFTFFHEAGHILLHDKKEFFLEEIDYKDKDIKKEKEADEFAVHWTFSEEEEKEVISNSRFLSKDQVREYSKKFQTNPAIIVGRLHFKKVKPQSWGKDFFKPIIFDSYKVRQESESNKSKDFYDFINQLPNGKKSKKFIDKQIKEEKSKWD